VVKIYPLQHATFSAAVGADEVVDGGEVVEGQWLIANCLEFFDGDGIEHVAPVQKVFGFLPR
jgi:hypothetical protein